ncbi:sugar phosphate isomerase/epimerase family protein [Egicoccus sp. AB-alg2]|uniref:sugar phosphate isomerase/epimerase family protein n=1 Tax=Egicoccus sp. AB-alg2 TaxID=3242693 RepID=UPI00359EB437
MKLGMNLFLWDSDVTDEKYLPLFERLKTIGFDGVEVPIFDARPEAIAALARRLDDLGLERTAVTAAGAHNAVISADPAVRQAGIDHVRAVLECCHAGGMDLLAGPFYAGLGVFSGTGPTDEEWERGVQAFRGLSEDAAAAGVTLALEYLNRFEIYLLNSAADTRRLVTEVDHPHCRMMIDTFHSHIEEKDVGAAIRDSADVLVHMQLAENDRSTPGSGQVHWDAVFGALADIGYDGWLTIEAFGSGLPELAAATCIWRRMFDSEDQLAADGHAFVRDAWAAAVAAAPERPRLATSSTS